MAPRFSGKRLSATVAAALALWPSALMAERLPGEGCRSGGCAAQELMPVSGPRVSSGETVAGNQAPDQPPSQVPDRTPDRFGPYFEWAGRAARADRVCPDLQVDTTFLLGVAAGAGIELERHPRFLAAVQKMDEEIRTNGVEVFCASTILLFLREAPYLLRPAGKRK